MQRLKYFVESNAFGVCAFLSDFLGIPISQVRLFFIYVTFIGVGSPILIYLTLAFFLRISNYFFRKRKTVWDL